MELRFWVKEASKQFGKPPQILHGQSLTESLWHNVGCPLKCTYSSTRFTSVAGMHAAQLRLYFALSREARQQTV